MLKGGITILESHDWSQMFFAEKNLQIVLSEIIVTAFLRRKKRKKGRHLKSLKFFKMGDESGSDWDSISEPPAGHQSGFDVKGKIRSESRFYFVQAC